MFYDKLKKMILKIFSPHFSDFVTSVLDRAMSMFDRFIFFQIVCVNGASSGINIGAGSIVLTL